jgi:hypothetical protein
VLAAVYELQLDGRLTSREQALAEALRRVASAVGEDGT